MGSRRAGASRGFTLLELVIVISITAVLAGAVATFITAPMQGYRDLTRRARLVDVAESSLRRITRDIRRGLPNSIRVSAGGLAIELLHAADGREYRLEDGGVHTGDSDRLRFDPGGDDRWNALGRFRALAFAYGTPLPAGTRVAVYPTDPATVYAEAAGGANPGVITPAGTTVTIQPDGDEDAVVLSAAHEFRFASPARRFYVVDTPVSYLCDPAAQTLTRYSGYAIAAVQPVNPAAPPLAAGASALVSRRVTGCTFSYFPGTPARDALATLELTLSEAGEQIRLLHQVHVENIP